MGDGFLGDIVGLAIGIAVLNEVDKNIKKRRKKNKGESSIFNF